MQPAIVIFAPSVDEAILRLIDYIDPSDIPVVLNFLENVQSRLVNTLSTAPLGGTKFKGELRFFVIDGYVFLYEYVEAVHQVHILDMIGPGQNWR